MNEQFLLELILQWGQINLQNRYVSQGKVMPLIQFILTYWN